MKRAMLCLIAPPLEFFLSKKLASWQILVKCNECRKCNQLFLLYFLIYLPKCFTQLIFMKKIIVLLTLVIIASCSSKKDKEIIGTWQMHKVIQSGEDVTSEHNPFGERAVIFSNDSIFESNGRPLGKNTGR